MSKTPEDMGWRKIVGVPKDGSQVIVGGPGYAYEAVWIDLTRTWMVLDSDGQATELVREPLYYKPMPEPPLP